MFKVFDSTLFLNKLLFEVIIIYLKVIIIIIKGFDSSLKALDHSKYISTLIIEYNIISSKLIYLLNSIYLLKVRLSSSFVKGVNIPEGWFVIIKVKY